MSPTRFLPSNGGVNSRRWNVTKREARRLAIINIVQGAESDLDNGGEYWCTNSETGEELAEEDVAKVEEQARIVFRSLEKRARMRDRRVLHK